MKIAIVGCGIAGTTVAFLLAEQGHEVTLFEQASECRPVGAGIMIQASGQDVLQSLGLLEPLAATSQRLHGMTAELASGRTLVRLDFRKLRPDAHALGVHRGTLFQMLLDRCRRSGVAIRTGFRAVEFDAPRGELRSADGETHGQVELLILADGSRSELRKSLGMTARVTEYSHGALWTTGPCNFQPDRLYQLVDGTQRLVGLLPIGPGRCSYFWGLSVADWPKLAASSFDRWRDEALRFCPPSEPILSSLQGFSDLTFGSYRSVAVRVPYRKNVILIGDASHATSPHLGQGANLALEDAACLAECLASTQETGRACELFHQLRARKVRFYRQLTAILSPFFQSHSIWRGSVRNLALPLMPHLPFVGQQMLYTLSGHKRGWLG
jgi:2-polyprenyl-6-methoxyphenol hydroxylase-like FAD-dependent oxidoreductase